MFYHKKIVYWRDWLNKKERINGKKIFLKLSGLLLESQTRVINNVLPLLLWTSVQTQYILYLRNFGCFLQSQKGQILEIQRAFSKAIINCLISNFKIHNFLSFKVRQIGTRPVLDWFHDSSKSVLALSRWFNQVGLRHHLLNTSWDGIAKFAQS